MFMGRMYSSEMIRVLVPRNGNGFYCGSVLASSHVCRTNDFYAREVSRAED